MTARASWPATPLPGVARSGRRQTRSWMGAVTAFAMAAIVGLSLGGPAQAETMFSSVGFGRWVHPVDARSAGMGDVSVVVPTPYNFAPRNPAMLAYLPKAAGHLMVGSSLTRAETGLETNNRADARLPLLGVGIPLKPGVVLGLTAFPLAAVRYDLSQQIEGDPDYLLRTKGSGTWTDVAATFAARGGNGALGLQVGIPVSGFGETVTREFSTEGYTTRTEEWQTELRDALFAVAGAQYQLWFLGLGGFVQLPTEGTVENVQELPDGSESKSSYTVGFPAVYGGGASLKLTKSFTIAGEYRRFPWSEIEINGENWRESANELDFINGFKDIDAYGAGIEWVNGVGSVSRSVWDHLSYRIGYSFQPWLSAGPNLGRVTDESATIGLGIPFERGNGAIDIALRYTRRLESESDLREDVIAFLFGISFGGQPRDY